AAGAPGDRRAAQPVPLGIAAGARREVPAPGHQGGRPPPSGTSRTARREELATHVAFARAMGHTRRGGSALVRRQIQTPSAGPVRSAVNRRGGSSSELPL